MSTIVTRKQYNSEGTGTTDLGLPYASVSEEFDGKVEVGAMHIEDAFEVDTIDITDDHSEGLVALAGEIALVQQQERCVPTGMTGTADPEDAGKAECLAVPGFVMEAVTDGEGKVQYRLPVDGEGNPVFTDTTEYVEMDESTALATALGVDRLFLFPASKAVSFWGTLSGVGVLCDGRKSMAGYSVSGAAEVAWVPVPWSWWQSDKVQAVRSELLTALGIGDYGDTADVADLCKDITVTDGELSGDVVLADKERLFFASNGDTAAVRQFGEVSVDGSGTVQWALNKSFVVALFAAVPKVSMQSVLGLAAVFVGINGGVPEWMVSAVKTYGIPLGNLVKAFGSYGSSIKAFFVGDKTPWITNPNKALLNTELICEKGDVIEIRLKETISGNQDLVMFGWRWGTHANCQELYGYQYNGGARVYADGLNYQMTSDTDTLVKIDTGTGAWNINGSTGTASLSRSFSNNSSVYPFVMFMCGADWLSTSSTGDPYTSIQHLIITRDGVLQRFMIPAWNDTEVGMYDLANGKFYGSYNSNVFTYSLE